MDQRRVLIFIIVLMSALGLLSTDIYLPSLPTVVAFFGTTPTLVELTISFFLFGLSISQLFYGPLADRFSRKRILIVAIFLYVIASLGCIVSQNITMLIVCRFAQAVGAASGMTIGRSFIVDAFSPDETAKIFATVFPFVGLSPALAPIIGGYLEVYFGWKSPFVLLLILGIILLYLIIKYLPSHLNASKKNSMSPINIVKNYGELLINRKFIGYMLTPSIAYVAYFAYITESSFILSYNHFSADSIGMSYLSLAIGYISGNLVSRKLVSHYKLNKVLVIGYSIFLLSGLSMFAVSHLFEFNAVIFLIPVTILTFSDGFLIPLGSAGVLSNFKKKSGYASGLLGFLQLAFAFASSAIISYINHGSYVNVAIYILIVNIVGCVLFYLLILRDKSI